MNQNKIDLVVSLLQTNKSKSFNDKSFNINSKLINIVHQSQSEQLQQVKGKFQTCLYELKKVNHLIKINKVEFMNKLRPQKSSNLFNEISNIPKANSNSPSQSFNSLSSINQRQLFANSRTFQYELKNQQSINGIQNSKLYSLKCKKQQEELVKGIRKMKPVIGHIFNNEKLNAPVLLRYTEESTISYNHDLTYKVYNSLDQISLNQKQNKKSKSKQFKIKKHLYQSAMGKALTIQNRFFPTNPTLINPKQVQKLGLYESQNRFRKQQITQQMKCMSPKIQKKTIQSVKVCKTNQLFLTRPKQAVLDLNALLRQQFVINESKPSRYFQSIHTCDLQARQVPVQNLVNEIKQTKLSRKVLPCTQLFVVDSIKQDQQSNHPLSASQIDKNQQNKCHQQIVYLQIKNYNLQTTQSLSKFKIENIQVWHEILSFISQIITFLKSIKMNSCKFKANFLLQYWSGKKLTNQDLQRILKITKKQLNNKIDQTLINVINVLKAKRQRINIIQQKKRQTTRIRWVYDRMIGLRKMKKQKQYKVEKALQIHQKVLDGTFKWQIQIYVSSFSQCQFVRSTTQFMQSFESMFSHLWKQSSKQLILIIPTINSQILQLYQQKIKIKSNVTIICPEINQFYPANISLAGALLFSYQALNKIRKLIKGRNAVIIPGKIQDPKYQLLISQFLRAPLMTSLRPSKSLQFQRNIFSLAQLSVLPFVSIPDNSSISLISQRMAKLIVDSKGVKQWMFKINGQFGGHGLATFSLHNSKLLKSIISSCKDSFHTLSQYLQKNLKLKLKINFQNSLFMLGDYLQRFASKGGIIQQLKENVQSFEVSFFVEDKNHSSIVSCFKSFAINNSNKAFIYQPIVNKNLARIIPKLKDTLETNQYLGYVSINMIMVGQQVYGIQIKPYLTQLSSVEPFIKAIQNKRQLNINLRGNSSFNANKPLVQIDIKQKKITKRSSRQVFEGSILKKSVSIFPNLTVPNQEPLVCAQFTYLFIPNLIISNVQLSKKAQFIQNLLTQQMTHRKYDILTTNIFYLTNGLTINLLIVGKEIKKIKKIAIQTVRLIQQNTNALKTYQGKSQLRDTFQFGDIVKALTQIKS